MTENLLGPSRRRRQRQACKTAICRMMLHRLGSVKLLPRQIEAFPVNRVVVHQVADGVAAERGRERRRPVTS